MADTLVFYEERYPAVIITLNRPEKRNALSRSLIAALTDAFQRSGEDASARCVILTGEGSVFCAGMDLTELAESLDSEVGKTIAPTTIWDDALHLAALYELIYSLPKPTIAAINGPAVAGGAGLVTVCDLAIAVPAARFGYPEVKRGLVAAIVMPHLLRHVGERTARFLLLTGELIGAEEAYLTGLINKVVPPGSLLEQAFSWANLLAEGGPQALNSTKVLLKKFSGQAIPIEETAQASAGPRLTVECQEGLKAFFAKRPAPWAPRSST